MAVIHEGDSRLHFADGTLTALLGLAVGDTFGCPFEFHKGAPELARKSMLEAYYLRGFEDCRLPVRRCRTAGLYTDDTQQALVLLWVMSQMEERGKPLGDAGMVGELFIRVCRRMASEQVGPIGFGVHRGTGKNFREAVLKPTPPDTAGLGAAMRIGPPATMLPRESLIPWVVRVSSTTTLNPVAMAAAAMFACRVWLLAQPDSSDSLQARLDGDSFGLGDAPDPVGDAWQLLERACQVLDARGEEGLLEFAEKSGEQNRKISCAADGFALTGVPWVLQHARDATSFEDALVSTCSSGGDTDTVCAMVGCLAALRFGPDNIPTWMTEYLVGLFHIRDPSQWHPILSERAYVKMDIALQRALEQEVLAAAKARKREQKTDESEP